MNNNIILSDILNHAIKTVPYYMNINENRHTYSLNDFPVVNKQIINEHYNDFLSNKFNFYSDDIEIMSTTGSSGVYLKVLWRRVDRLYSDCYAWKARNRWYGISPTDKWISFHSEVYAGNRLLNNDLKSDYIISKNLMSINMKLLYDMNYEKIIDLIVKYNPKWMFGFPSILNSIASYINNNNIHINGLEYIECMGEVLFPHVRANLSKAFCTAHVSNMYGSTETGVIALECPFGHMHILEQNCIVEVSPNNSLILTSLVNRIMPFIRYEIGDIAFVKNVECKCGYNSLCIDELKGRNNDFVMLENNNCISAMSLIHIFESLNDEFIDLIRSFIITQEKYDYFVVDMEINKKYYSWKDIIIEKTKKKFCDFIKNNIYIDVNIHIMPIQIQKNTKFKFYINNIQKGV